MSGWLKAGLIGAVILVVLKVVEVVPCVICCGLPLEQSQYTSILFYGSLNANMSTHP